MNRAPPESVLAEALDRQPSGPAELEPLRALRLRAGLAVGVVTAVILAWSALAPIRGAVIAQGVIKTERDRKTVRHQEGGIVRQILVREGQSVTAGEPLLVIGDVRTDAILDLQQDQWIAESLRRSRLEAEVSLSASFRAPAAIAPSPSAGEYLRREQVLFDARRKTLLEQQSSLNTQVEATENRSRHWPLRPPRRVRAWRSRARNWP